MTVSAESLTLLRSLLERRHSARAFRPEQVPRSLIEGAVETARHAPSWCNTQPWNLEITQGAATDRFRQALVAHQALGAGAGAGAAADFPFPAKYVGVYRERRLETALRLYDAVGVARGDRAASGRQTALNFELFGAPHVAILSTDADLGVYGAVDCGIFLAVFLLALEAAGVASIAQAALASYSPMVRDHFGLPEQRRVLCGVSFGWEDTEHPANGFRTSRVGVDDVINWHA